MVSNIKMQELISDIDFSLIEPKNYYSISQKENQNNEKYWTVNKEIDCTLCQTSASGLELTYYEYNENEIYISNSKNLKDVLNLSLKIFVSIKKILQENYNDTVFDIIFSIDLGKNEIPPSAVIRFYAVRNNFRIIDLKDVENFKSEAILIDTVNDEKS